MTSLDTQKLWRKFTACDKTVEEEILMYDMEPENRQRIQQNESYLRENLSLDYIYSDLLSKSVISKDDEERIRCEQTECDRVRKFLRILERKPPGTYAKFLKVLEKENSHIKEVLDKCEIDEEALQRSKKTTDERMKTFLLENYQEEEKGKVSVTVLRESLKEDFIKHGEIYFPDDEHITRIVHSTFKQVVLRKKDRKKKEYIFYNLIKSDRIEDTEEDEALENDAQRSFEQGEDSFEKCIKTQAITSEKTSISNVGRKPMDEMTKFEICELIIPKLHQNAMDFDLITGTLDKENVAGKAFKHLDNDDVKELFPSLKFGERKLILVLRDELIKEEEPFIPITKSDADIPMKDVSCSSQQMDTELKQNFRETFRKFGSTGKGKESYRKGAVVNTSNMRIHDLIQPVHRYMHATDIVNPSVPEWIAEESVIFASACMNERTNGTIHFGICEKQSEKYKEGEIIGINVDKSICQEHISRMIRKSFYKNQQETAFKCIRPPQFIEVFTQGIKSQTLLIVEIDVVPESELIQDEAVYIRIDKKARIFKFENDTSNPVILNDEEITQFMKHKTQLSDLRKRMEKKPSNIEIKEDLRQKFLNLFTGGDEILTHDIYPVLFLSPVDSSMGHEFIDENFKFIVDIDANAVFDFDPSSDARGMYNFYENKQEQIVKSFTTENFDRNSKENREKNENYSSMIDDLRLSVIKPWIFCNGYETMDQGPFEKLEWKQKRSEGFKEALRFFYNEIPNERAFVLFLLFSKNYEIMLEAADEVLVKFKDQWVMIAPNDDIAHTWMDELERRKMTDRKSLVERCVIGMPWQHVNKMISDAVMPEERTRCEIITSTGAFCSLRERVKNELFDLNVLSRKECEDSDIISDDTKRERRRREVEEDFFKGKEVTWWNLWFKQNHVLQRSLHTTLLKMVRGELNGDHKEEDNKVGIVNLIHQPGAGGTTTAKQILWDLRKEYRCCVVKQISEDTCDQITTLRNYEDPETPKPVLVLLDNEDDEKIQSLYTRLESQALVASRRNQTQFKVFCILLLCTRRANLPKKVNKHSMTLKHELDEQELAWFKTKNDSLETYFNSDSGCDPRLLISFNILKENFNKEYIKRAVQEFVDVIASQDEQHLLKYLSLLNTYDIDVKPIPLSAFDPLMQNISKNRKGTTFSYGLVSRRQQRKGWETTISSSLQILLNRTSRAGLGGQLKALSIINSLFAKEILFYLKSKLKQSTSNIVLEFLASMLFQINNQSQKQLLGVIKDIMKKREIQESGKKDKFSRLVAEILENEDVDKAAEILIKVFEISGDPMIAQQISRLYIHYKNWDKAVKYAIEATDKRPQNSYLWDTFAQIYKSQLVDKYTDTIRTEETLSNTDIKAFVRIAFDGTQIFRKEQQVSLVEKTTSPNDAGFYGELKVVILMLDLIGLCPSIPKHELHKFLVDERYLSPELDFLDEDTIVWLKQLHVSTELTMRTLEEKNTQVKEDVISGVFQSKLRSKDNLKELTHIRENLDQYFGEDNDAIPEHLKPNDVPLFIRRRVRRLGGRSLPSILDIGRNTGGKEKLKRMKGFLEMNVSSRYCDAYDLVTLIGVALVMNLKTGENIDNNQFVDWSKQLYDLLSTSDERPSLESYLYLVMFHWPTQNREKKNLCAASRLVEAIKKWRIAFKDRHPRQDGHPGPKKDTTYFFLGDGGKMDGIVYYEELLSENKGRFYKRDDIWREPHVLKRLKRLNGTLVNEGKDVSIQVETGGGNKTAILISTSMPIAKRWLWQKRVFFVLGFGWGGPMAYDVSQDDPTETAEDRPSRIPSEMTRSQISQIEKQKTVKTHQYLNKKLDEINKELEKIRASKHDKRSKNEIQQKKHHLKEQREKLISERDEFLRD